MALNPVEEEGIPVSLLGIERRDVTIWIASEPVPLERFPPCMKNIIERAGGGGGRHRASAILAAFLGQAGWSEEEARELWMKVAERTDVPGKIFTKWFQRMNCPRCETIKRRSEGYPHLGLAGLEYCQPDENCALSRWPVGYSIGSAEQEKGWLKVIRTANLARLFNWTTGKEMAIDLSDDERMELEDLLGGHKNEEIIYFRARIQGRLMARFLLRKGGEPRRRVLSELL
jgi:hypothetical protein